MKLTHNMKSTGKSYKPPGLHRSPQATERDHFPVTSGQKRQDCNQQQIYTTRSTNSKICPYENNLIYSQVNDRINQLYGKGYAPQTKQWSGDKRSIEDVDAARQRSQSRSNEQILANQLYHSLKSKIMQQVLTVINEHKVQASNSLRQGIIKIDENLKRQCIINFSRQFLPLSFIEDADKQFQQIQQRIKQVEIALDAYIQNQKSNGNNKGNGLNCELERQKQEKNKQQLQKMHDVIKNLQQILTAHREQTQNEFDGIKQEIKILLQSQQKYQKDWNFKLAEISKIQNQNKTKNAQSDREHDQELKDVKGPIEKVVKDVENFHVELKKMEERQVGIQGFLRGLGIDCHQRFDILGRSIQKLTANQVQFGGQLNKLRSDQQELRKLLQGCQKSNELESQMMGFKAQWQQRLNQINKNLKRLSSDQHDFGGQFSKFKSECQLMKKQLENIQKYNEIDKINNAVLHNFMAESKQRFEAIAKDVHRFVAGQFQVATQIKKLKLELEEMRKQYEACSKHNQTEHHIKPLQFQHPNTPRYQMKKTLSIASSMQPQPVFNLLSPPTSPQISPKNSQIQPQTNSLIQSSHPPKSMSLTFSLESIGDVGSPKAKNPVLASISSLKDIKSTKYILDNQNNLMDDAGNYILDEGGQQIKLSQEQLFILKESNIVKYHQF